MVDFANELGKSLDKNLRLFKSATLSVEDIIEKNKVEGEVAEEILFALYRRGFIRNVDNVHYERPEDIGMADYFVITVEGRDYIELKRSWKWRFLFRFVVCPSAVSFVTAINAVTIWNFIKEIAECCSQMWQVLNR